MPQNSLNNKLFNGRGEINLTGVKFIAANSFNLAATTTDIYTAPAGKRAAVYNYSAYNTNVGSVTVQVKVKISGVYYPIIISTVITTATAGINIPASIILEPGESLSITTSGTGINFLGTVMEYDSSNAMFSKKITNLATGNNTIYTCPANTTATILDNKLSIYGIPSSPSSLYVYNGSGAAVIYQAYLVNSGGTAGTTNQYFSNTGTANGAIMTCALCTGLGAGDFVVINSASATAGQFSWINIMETT